VSTVRAHVIVSGLVQGVYFRESTRRAALDRNTAGWVRNLPDHRVEAVFEGEPEAVESMIAWVRVGPPRAAVDDVETTYERPEGLLGFNIRV
jgi:acylphosphatase